MKKLAFILCVITLTTLLTACGHIEDTNGDDTRLVTITLEKLAGKSISSTSSGVSTSSTRVNKTTMTQHEDIDVDVLAISGGKASGISSILATSLVAGDALRIDCLSSVSSGNLGLILISPSNEVLYQFTIGEIDFCEIIAAESGIYIVRMGAESFSGEIELERTLG